MRAIHLLWGLSLLLLTPGCDDTLAGNEEGGLAGKSGTTGQGGASGSSGQGGAPGCLPGKQFECPCPGTAAKGVQVCEEDGLGVGPCTGCAAGGTGGAGGDGASGSENGGSDAGGTNAGGTNSGGTGVGGTNAGGGSNETDDAEIAASTFPTQLTCAQTIAVTVSLKNTGTSTWTKAAGYRLEATSVDPFSTSATCELGDGDAVEPGATHDFSLVITGPQAPGTATTSWRMVHGAGQGFGPSDEHSITTGCGPQPPFDLAKVVILGSPDVRGFATTSELTSLEFSPGTIHIDHSKRGQWPPVLIDPDGTTQEATIWVFFSVGDTWYGTGGERLRPDQTDKELSQPSQIGPGWLYDPNRWHEMTNYIPPVGDQVGFMVVAGSTRSDNNVIVEERTKVVLIPFPADNQSSSFPPFTPGELAPGSFYFVRRMR